MKKFTRTSIGILSFWAIFHAAVFGQNAIIVGPPSLCIGECGTYELVSLDSFDIISVQWFSNGGAIVSNPGSNSVVICASDFGFDITAIGVFSNGDTIFSETFVEVVFGVNPLIISTSATCPQDSSGSTACDKICAFGTGVYEAIDATGAPLNSPVTWQVLGAEDFTVNGNSVTVEWGAPGQGEVTATVGGGNSQVPFQIFCGQESIDPNQPNTTGTGYVSIFGGVPPFLITVTDPTGVITTYNGISATLPGLFAGTYNVSVTDASGNSDQCQFDIETSFQECWLSANPVGIQHIASCNVACDGAITLAPIGGVSTNYTFVWNTGSTTPNISGLCQAGFYSVTITDFQNCTATEVFQIACLPNTCSGSASLCVEILEEPKAGIGSQPPAIGSTIEICQGQTVYFENNSTNATSYIWDFGDLYTSTQFEPSHAYPTPGTFTVSLIARNECYCSDTTFVTINVLTADVPIINCVGTVCEGETVTYSTDASCTNYNWQISGGGIILDGGGVGDNFVTVEWPIGPEGNVSLDVSGCAGSVCILPNIVPIPIISDNVQIEGPNKVCEGSTEEYFIPNYQGTEITWTVQGLGSIVEGQGSERISVNWTGAANVSNPQRVIVEFQNCYLGCGGKDTLLVNIVPSFYVEGPIEVCESTSGTYQSRNTLNSGLMNSHWQLFNASGTVVWSSAGATNTANIPFNFPPGSYIVHTEPASVSSFCNDRYDVFVKLIAAPPPPTGITGPTEICPGESYSYEASGLPTSDFTWTFTNGTPANFNGNPANVVWGTVPPYTASVVQIATTGLACTSPPFNLNVNPIPTFSITGDGQVCKEETGNYSVPFFENIDYQWLIMPMGFGTITSGDGTESVEIQWHESGPATVSVTICGTTETFNVNVLVLPEPYVDDFEVCQGQTLNVTTTVPFSTYKWKEEDGSQISTNPIANLIGGYYEVEVTDANGCFGDTTFFGLERPSPYVRISTPSYYAICPGAPPVIIYSTTTTSGYDFEWFHNGNPIGGNTPTLSTNQPGNYQVIATNSFGCMASSNILTLEDCATAGGTCVGGICTIIGIPLPGCTPLGSVDFSFSQTGDCDVVDFMDQSVNDIPGSHFWYFGDNTSSALENPSHTYPAPGYYTVVHLVNVPAAGGGSCPIYTYKDVLIPAVANFSHSGTCPGTPVNFNDGTAFITGQSITGWDWDFGDPASGAANSSSLENPSHVYAAAGTYTVTLIVTMSLGCQVTEVKTIEIHAAPTVDFALPSQSCEQVALPFDAMLSADYASLWWNFGDPASGPGNQSEVENTFHAFPAAGNYTVTLSATNIYGCSASTDKLMTVTPNTLGGTIAYSQPSPICEGDQITLTAPPGGIGWNWDSGETTIDITVFESGTYDVTVTSSEGCTYSPSPAPVDVFGEPNGIIKAVEYNEFGQPVAFFENNHTVCEGEDVNLLIQGSLNYSYVWSNGEPGGDISFTEDKGNLLSVGTHNFTVTVTDNTNGCTSLEGPFTVTVNPVPSVQIASSPAGFLCENNAATLSVVGPNPALTYGWNTGETSTSITAIAGGTYFVQAVNQFGCKGRSNEITINNAPDIDLVPTGCHSRCNPDTMCLPNTPLVASYQWFLDGNPMPGPNGSLANPIFTQSGEYSLEMTDIYGCTSVSELLSLDLFPGFGDILGNVYFDVNENGIIDGPDTLVSGINVFLNDGSANLDTVTSIGGAYIFVDILSTNYTIVLDTANLPAGWSAYLVNTLIDLVGCDVEEQFDWLLTNACLSSTTAVSYEACPGDGVTYDGTFIPVGTTQGFVFTNAGGCDSIITVTVSAFPDLSSQLELQTCPGTTVIYEGVELAPGDQQDFVLTDQNGCDSVVQVSVVGLPTDAETLQLSACPNSFATYQGTQLFPGDMQEFTFTNQSGCDSVVTVNVVALPTDTTALPLSVCENETIFYEGTELSPGDQQDFVLTDQNGCDSVVQVSVSPIPTSSGTAQLMACPGSTVTYQGMQLSPGDQEDFILQNQLGCDSIVSVTVVAAPVDTVSLALQVCEGETMDYNGQELTAGDEQAFILQNQFGCDSVVQVSVSGYPSVIYDLSADKICWNENNGSIEVQNVSGSTSPFLFSLDGISYQIDPLFDGLAGGSYTIFLQDANDCVFEEQIEIPTIQPIVVEVKDETLVCGDSVRLSPLAFSELPLAWQWQNGPSSEKIWVQSPGTYTFQVSNDCETVERSVNVSLDESKPVSLIYMPNSFSPNGDLINDCYHGFLSPSFDLQFFVLKIFDRWGDMMFQTSDPAACWDGYLNGKAMDPAVFVWFVEMHVRNCDGTLLQIFKEGDIHLVK